MIVSNRSHMFGLSHFGVVKVPAFGCAVCTAPEGFFKGCSTIFQAFQGSTWSIGESKLVAKAMLNPILSKQERAALHACFLTSLDEFGNSGIDLAGAIDEIFALANDRKLIVASVNKACELIGENDFPDTMRRLCEHNKGMRGTAA